MVLLSKAVNTNEVYLRDILILPQFQLNCLYINDRVAFSLILSVLFVLLALVFLVKPDL